MTFQTDETAIRLDYAEIEQYRPRLMRQALRMVRNSGTAEDLVQECLMNAWIQLDRFRGECRPYTWLYRILLNLVFNHRKRHKREVLISSLSLEGGAEAGLEIPDEATPEQHLIAKQRAQSLIRALERLPFSLSETLALRYLHDLSYEEIADTLDLPVGTVRSRLHRTHRVLGIG